MRLAGRYRGKVLRRYPTLSYYARIASKVKSGLVKEHRRVDNSRWSGGKVATRPGGKECYYVSPSPRH